MGLTVLSYNIHKGGSGRLPLIVDLLRSAQPDAIALQEATSRASAQTLAHALKMTLVFGEATSGVHVAWLSRLPVVRWQNYPLPALTRTLLEIEIA